MPTCDQYGVLVQTPGPLSLSVEQQVWESNSSITPLNHSRGVQTGSALTNKWTAALWVVVWENVRNVSGQQAFGKKYENLSIKNLDMNICSTICSHTSRYHQKICERAIICESLRKFLLRKTVICVWINIYFIHSLNRKWSFSRLKNKYYRLHIFLNVQNDIFK